LIAKEIFENVIAELEKQDAMEEECFFKYPYNEDVEEIEQPEEI
jgi:hypothetical protein